MVACKIKCLLDLRGTWDLFMVRRRPMRPQRMWRGLLPEYQRQQRAKQQRLRSRLQEQELRIEELHEEVCTTRTWLLEAGERMEAVAKAAGPVRSNRGDGVLPA